MYDKMHKRVLLTLGLGIYYLLLFAVSCQVGTLIFESDIGLLIGGIMMLVAILPQLLSKRNSLIRLIPITVNGVATGFMASAYYLHFGIATSFGKLIELSAIFVLSLIVICLLAYLFPERKRVFTVIGLICAVIALIVSVVMWIKGNLLVYSFTTFCIIHLIIDIVVLDVSLGDTDRDALRDFSFGSFSIAVVVGIIALVAIAVAGGDCDCDCDGCDCCDCSDGGSQKTAKKTKKRERRLFRG